MLLTTGLPSDAASQAPGDPSGNTSPGCWLHGSTSAIHCSSCMLKRMQDRHATILSVCAWLSMWIEVDLILQGHLRSGCGGVGMAAAAISSSDIDRVEPLSTCWSARACDARPALASITRDVGMPSEAVGTCHGRQPCIAKSPCRIASCALSGRVAAPLTLKHPVVGRPAMLAC
jgi:hypothetical protein